MQRNILLTIGLLLAITLSIPTANASILTFTDRNAYMQALSGTGYAITNIDFENANQTAQGKPENVISANGITIQEVTNGGGVYLSTFENQGAVVWFFLNNKVTVTLPTNSYAFGFEIGNAATSAYTPPPTINGVTLSTGEVFDSIYGTSAPPAFSFFGFISDTPVTNFIFKPYVQTDAIMDNFVYAQRQPAPVPEPTTFALFAVGLAGLALVGRKKGRA